jgi:hypothetical protein
MSPLSIAKPELDESEQCDATARRLRHLIVSSRQSEFWKSMYLAAREVLEAEQFALDQALATCIGS